MVKHCADTVHFFFISVIYIKEDVNCYAVTPDDDSAMNSSDIKKEPVQDDLVSNNWEYWYNSA